MPRDAIATKIPHNVEHGKRQEFRIIDALRHTMLDDRALATLLGVTPSNISIYLMRMRKQGRVRIAGFVRDSGVTTKCRPRALYGLGNAPDAVYVPLRPTFPRATDRRADNRARILSLLATESMTLAQLCEKLHLTASPVRGYIRDLRTEKLIRISSWKQCGARNGWAPRYIAGSAKDRARPPAQTQEQNNEKRRNNPEARKAEAERRRQRMQLAKLVRRPQSIFSALGL